MIKLVRIVAPKIYLRPPVTELEAGTLATSELCLFVLLMRIAYLVVSCFCFGREFHFMQASRDLKGILRESFFLSYFEKIAHMSVVLAYVSLWLCGSVALWLCMLGCLLQELIRLNVL